jgi:selenocysteine lyase/cysteine desulfurase
MTSGTIYLDNAATTWPKPEPVYRAADAAMREHGANPGRGSYRMSVDAQHMIDETRQEVCRLFNAPNPERVIFTLNCTDALNLVLNGLIESGDRIVTGPMSIIP